MLLSWKGVQYEHTNILGYSDERASINCLGFDCCFLGHFGFPQNRPLGFMAEEIIPPQATPAPLAAKTSWTIPLILILALFSLGISAYLFWQNQQLRQQLASIQAQTPTSTMPSPSPVLAASPTPDPTIDWQTYSDTILKIEYKLPKGLGLLEMSGQEVNGDTGTQYCLIYQGEVSLIKIAKAYAATGPCGGGKFNFGTVSKDYSAGRDGGFGDMSGYFVDNGQFFARFVNGGKYLLPGYLVEEKTNPYGVKYLKITGESKLTDYGGEQMKLPTLGTPGKGWLGALVNLDNDRYAGFNLSLQIDSKTDEVIFDQILDTFRLNQ